MILPDLGISKFRGSDAIVKRCSGADMLVMETMVSMVVLNDAERVFFMMEL